MRVVFLMDKIMRKSLLSGKRCPFDFWNGLRYPSHYGNRNIENKKG
jgi:hypothetical protein